MIGTVLVLLVAVSALIGAACLHARGLIPALVVAYVFAVAEVTILTLVLSPFHAVTRGGLAAGEAAVLAGTLAAWWVAGRPPLPVAGLRSAAAGVLRDPALAVLAVVVSAGLVYELVLVFATPPNNWDSLTYHLARAAAWFQHGGVYWIPNAPTARMNEFQPGAEQLVLYLFVATGKGALFALPQYIAQLAAMASIYTAARRLGFEPRAAAPAALLFPTLSLVALESTTGQNDVVAASLAIAAAALLLGRSAGEELVAGVALGLGVGVKLTVAIAVPVLLALAACGGRRTLVRFVVSAACGFAALGAWGYVLNAANTSHLLGHGEGRIENTTHPSFPGSVATAYRIVYRLFDLSGFSNWMIWALAIAGVAVAAALLGVGRDRQRGSRAWVSPTTAVALPFLVPVLVIGLALGLRALGHLVHLPVNAEETTSAPFSWTVNRNANEDFSAFGPLGAAVAVTSFVLSVVFWRRGRDRRRLVLALAVPLFVVVLALGSKYNPWLARFLIIPLALTMPLVAVWFRRRGVAIGVVVVASSTLVLAHVRSQLKPIEGASTPPWAFTQVEAVDQPWVAGVASGLVKLDRLVPASACVGALLDPDDPTYLLYGPTLGRRLLFLRAPDEERQADQAGLTTIIVKSSDYQDAQQRLRTNGWRLLVLSRYFTIAHRAPGDSPPSCAHA